MTNSSRRGPHVDPLGKLPSIRHGSVVTMPSEAGSKAMVASDAKLDDAIPWIQAVTAEGTI